MVFENGRAIVVLLATILIASSLLLTYRMADTLHEKERHDVEVWAAAMESASRDIITDYTKDALINRIISYRNNIPFVIIDEEGFVVAYHRVPSEAINSPTQLRRTIADMVDDNPPITVHFGLFGEYRHTIYYGHSLTLQTLYIFPFIQILIIVIFVVVVFVVFRSLKQGEQGRVWAGLAKETAHQLGTPTSSLMGWVEYLREQPVDQMAVDEIQKDISHLTKIVDRFSKIGSETTLEEASLNQIVGNAVAYFRKRIPRNVTLEYDGLEGEEVRAKLNATLFEWVIENLMKNALDALQGHGNITVSIGHDNKNVWVDVSDTGKGIIKSKWKRIFEPGYTTKTRGWGLGLSLSHRIVVEYHKGKIAVVDSVIDKGTTIRVTLKKA